MSAQNGSAGPIEANLTDAQKANYFLAFNIFIVEGTIMLMASLPFVFVVGLNASLRSQKEYVIFAALSLSNGLNGIAYFLSGTIKLVKYYQAFILISRWQCFTYANNIVFHPSALQQTTMQLVVTIDRLLAISMPLRYSTFSNRYALWFVSVAGALQFIPYVVSGFMSYQYQTPEKPALCFLSYSLSANYFKYWYLLYRIVTASTSILLYIPITIQIIRVISKSHGLAEDAKLKRIKSVSITVGITAVFTFLSVLPDMASFFNINFYSSFYFYYVLPQVSGMVNSVIYTMRYKDLRTATKAPFMCCRKLIPVTANNTGVHVHPAANRNSHPILHRIQRIEHA